MKAHYLVLILVLSLTAISCSRSEKPAKLSAVPAEQHDIVMRAPAEQGNAALTKR